MLVMENSAFSIMLCTSRIKSEVDIGTSGGCSFLAVVHGGICKLVGSYKPYTEDKAVLEARDNGDVSGIKCTGRTISISHPFKI